MGKAREAYSFVAEWKRRWEPGVEALAYNGTTCDPTRVDPKVLDWVRENSCMEKPHFVKIINPNAAHGKPGLLLRNSSSLTVPSPFVRQHFRSLERVVTLENRDATRKWRVSFGTPKRDPQWLQGWDRVAADNNFQPADVVVFVLTANSRFRFTHFDAHGNLAQSGRKPARCSSRESLDQVQSIDNATMTTTTTTKKKKENSKRGLVELANPPVSKAAGVGGDHEIVAETVVPPARNNSMAVQEPCRKERRLNSSTQEPKRRQ